MAGNIYHEWQGTTLIITSDSGTSGADLKGSQGDVGVRGPQGAPGIIAGQEILEQELGVLDEKITEVNTAVDTKVNKAGDTISGVLNIEGALTLPNSPVTPSEATLTDTYSTRTTAKGAYDVVDGAETFVTKIQGNTEDTGDGFKNSYFKGVLSTSKNMFNTLGENNRKLDDAYTIEEGRVTKTNTSDQATHFVYWSKNYPAGTYTFSAYSENDANQYRVLFFTNTQIPGTAENRYYIDQDVTMIEEKNAGNSSYYKSVNNETKYFTFTAPSDFRLGIIMYTPNGTGSTKTITVDQIQLVLGTTKDSYVPYQGEDAGFTYNETLELGRWDYALPQEGKVYKNTAVHHFTEADTVENYKGETDVIYYYRVILNNGKTYAGVNSLNFVSKGIGVVYPTDNDSTNVDIGIYWGWSEPSVIFWSKKEVDYWATVEDFKTWLYATNVWIAYPIQEEVLNLSPKAPFYIAYPGGNEIVDNGGMGAEVPATITQIYSIHENPTEAANKAYVNNSLATKLDKSGGTITGNLIVEGKTDTALGAIVSKQNGIAYGLAYDGDAYKLGEGAINEDGDFTFNENEGLPIALRDDSSTFANNTLVKWSLANNKLVSAGYTVTDLINMINAAAKPYRHNIVINLYTNDSYLSVAGTCEITVISSRSEAYTAGDAVEDGIYPSWINGEVGSTIKISGLAHVDLGDGVHEYHYQINSDSVTVL